MPESAEDGADSACGILRGGAASANVCRRAADGDRLAINCQRRELGAPARAVLCERDGGWSTLRDRHAVSGVHVLRDCRAVLLAGGTAVGINRVDHSYGDASSSSGSGLGLRVLRRNMRSECEGCY